MIGANPGMEYDELEEPDEAERERLAALAAEVDAEEEFARQETPPAEGWRIRDLEELNRVLGRMARLERLQSENETLVAAEVNRLGEWLEKENEALAKRYRDLAAHVEVFARDNREALGKTRRLPHGTVSWRERKEGSYRWRQDMTAKDAKEALVQWALRQHSAMDPDDERILVTEEKRYVPDREAIEEYVQTLEGFTVPDGLEWVGPGESLSITTKEAK